MLRILVLEDDEAQQRLMRDVLEDEGNEVCVFSSVEPCLAHDAEHGHDLLITDLLVTGGLVPLVELHSLSPAVLVVSGHAERLALHKEAHIETLLKPYDIEDLMEMVRRLTAKTVPQSL